MKKSLAEIQTSLDGELLLPTYMLIAKDILDCAIANLQSESKNLSLLSFEGITVNYSGTLKDYLSIEITNVKSIDNTPTHEYVNRIFVLLDNLLALVNTSNHRQRSKKVFHDVAHKLYSHYSNENINVDSLKEFLNSIEEFIKINNLKPFKETATEKAPTVKAPRSWSDDSIDSNNSNHEELTTSTLAIQTEQESKEVINLEESVVTPITEKTDSEASSTQPGNSPCGEIPLFPSTQEFISLTSEAPSFIGGNYKQPQPDDSDAYQLLISPNPQPATIRVSTAFLNSGLAETKPAAGPVKRHFSLNLSFWRGNQDNGPKQDTPRPSLFASNKVSPS